MKCKHQAVERLDNVHGSAVKRLCDRYHNQYTPPPAPVQEWKPKNPEITWPKMRKESLLTKAEWMETDFPVYPLPKEVKGVVNIECWEIMIQELLSANNVDWGLIKIMKELLDQLVNGASSQVEPPSTALTQTNKWFSDPPQQLPRVVDALAYFTKNGHIAGPIFDLDKNDFKVNSIMAIDKPGGHIRVVGNLKTPIGQSFNEGISEDRKEDWHVSMTTTPSK